MSREFTCSDVYNACFLFLWMDFFQHIYVNHLPLNKPFEAIIETVYPSSLPNSNVYT